MSREQFGDHGELIAGLDGGAGYLTSKCTVKAGYNGGDKSVKPFCLDRNSFVRNVTFTQYRCS